MLYRATFTITDVVTLECDSPGEAHDRAHKILKEYESHFKHGERIDVAVVGASPRQMSPEIPVWRMSRPTSPGCYWLHVRISPHHQHVTFVSVSDKMEVRALNDTVSQHVLAPYFDGAQWLGPVSLEPPGWPK